MEGRAIFDVAHADHVEVNDIAVSSHHVRTARDAPLCDAPLQLDYGCVERLPRNTPDRHLAGRLP